VLRALGAVCSEQLGRRCLPPSELLCVLVGVLAFLALAVVAFAVVSAVTRATMNRLGLEPTVVLFYFGLADGPADELAARRAERRAGARRRRAAPMRSSA